MCPILMMRLKMNTKVNWPLILVAVFQVWAAIQFFARGDMPTGFMTAFVAAASVSAAFIGG